MSAPHEHAELSVKRFGGKPKDYVSIHNFLDSSKATHPDVRHRALTHNSWFIAVVMPLIFGDTIVNSDGKTISVELICRWHIMEDLNGSVPSAQDWLENIPLADWMNNGKDGDRPPSNKLLPSIEHDKIYLPEKPKIPSFLPTEDNSFRPHNCGGGGRID